MSPPCFLVHGDAEDDNKVCAQRTLYAAWGPRPELTEPRMDNRNVSWFINHSTNVSGGGWKDLTGGKEVQTRGVDGAKRSNMLRMAESVGKVNHFL